MLTHPQIKLKRIGANPPRNVEGTKTPVPQFLARPRPMLLYATGYILHG
jgi:hypothetical protein